MARVRLYIASGGELELDAALAAVSPYRREKALRCANEEKRRASLASELLLKAACGRTDYMIGKNGKPYFDGDPCFFSLSHSGEYALCAVSDVPIGADIELPGALRYESIAQRFFAEAECEYILHSASPADAFYSLWVQKEAIVKASGDGIAALKSAAPAACAAVCVRFGELYIGLCARDSEIEELEIHVKGNLS